ncbi:hypothetical protein SCLCIDRAFT_437033 [Scleroderma citrinum Foug A]|uniref:Uncharacterized protein n=1 Tax=Scleroderma citrinum Foug A TaxID=1036808 RepID=A0A0C2YUT2_9AGAM|nr:hypothetical protein SCLCIDRAFT_437033 [Scleroderma citrinum Foug A]
MTDQWWEVCSLCLKRDELSRLPTSDIVAVIEDASRPPIVAVICLRAKRNPFDCLYTPPCSLRVYFCVFSSAP